MQYPDRLGEFLDEYGWSWSASHAGRFLHRTGTLPQVLEEYFSSKPEIAPESDWSEWMTKILLAKLLGISRNESLTKWLKANSEHVQENTRKYRVHLSILPSQTRQRLVEGECRSLDKLLG